MRARMVLAGLFAVLLAACNAEPEQPSPSPALWEVTGEDGAHAFLFGTIHAMPEDTEWQTVTFGSAFAAADQLVVELDLIAAEQDQGRTFLELAQTPGQLPLLQRVAPEDREALQALLKRTDYSEDNFGTYESWAAALILNQELDLYPDETGADLAILQAAGDREVVELEGLEVQLGLFDSLPEQDQSDLLAGIAEEAARIELREGELFTAWLTGDIDRIAAELDHGMLADAELHDILLVRRNRAWLETVVAQMESGKTPFVAVGAAHLAGDSGLPALLAARGYTVRRLQ